MALTPSIIGPWALSALAFALPLMPRCQGRHPMVGPVPAPRPVAEYEPARGVLFGTGFHKAYAQLVRDIGPARASQNLERAREYQRFYETVMRSQPRLTYLILADGTHEAGVSRSEYDLWKPAVDAWRQEGFDVRLLRLDAGDTPSDTGDDAQGEDEWTRDYGPLAVKEGRVIGYVSVGLRGRMANVRVADEFGKSARAVDDLYPGGNFMATSRGVCATAIDGASDAEAWVAKHRKLLQGTMGCRRTIALRPLPNEGTRHVDLFAKFVADDRVVLADYRTDDVILDPSVAVATFRCQPADVARAAWDDCAYQGWTWPPGAVESHAQARRQPRVIRDASDMAAVVKARFPQAVVRETYRQGQLVAHSRSVAETFRRAGFAVTTVPAPRPTVAFWLERFTDAQGKALHEELSFDFVFPSYANTLLLNGHAYVPAYAGMAADNAAAVTTYQNLGFTTHAVDMTNAIEDGGAVHCLAKELH